MLNMEWYACMSFYVQVPVGVIPKNEVVREQLVQIMDELQRKYTPMNGIRKKLHLKLLVMCTILTSL